ncbi:MAG TPA: aldo/keto reductase [Terriglobales bacterium]|nr:aldo/keto reductase [Terriglobales bacterium]
MAAIPEVGSTPIPLRRATAAGTAGYAAGFPELARTQHFRKLRLPDPVQVASLGIGTYLGPASDAADEGYATALQAALAGGINLIDTAINYRAQRSERVIGRVLADSPRPREQVFVCTKAGFVPEGLTLPAGLIRPGELLAGCHCMSPVFLAHQLQTSLDNLGLDAVDVFYLHNPETQQAELSREEFYRRVQAAFSLLEKMADQGRIGSYGIATWSGLRVPPDAVDYLDLNRMVAIARGLAGEAHHFRFIQMPYNLGLPEAYALLNQTVEKPPYVSPLNAAFRLGLHTIASASLMSGHLHQLPEDARLYLQPFLPAASSDAELALQFVRSTPGITAGLVGMSKPEHVEANLRAIAVAPSPPAQVGRLLQQ